MPLSNDLKCTQGAQQIITDVVPNSGQHPLVDVRTAGLIDHGSLMAIQLVHCNLITIPICINELASEALIDSSASHNFLLKSLVQHVQQQTSSMNQLVVHMLECSKAFSIATCLVQLRMGEYTSIEIFHVLDSLLNMILGMPCFRKDNSHIHWDEQTICMYHNNQWVSLYVCGTDKAVKPSINAANDVKTEQDPVGPRKLHLESITQFGKSLKKADEVFVGFVSAIGECKFTHRTVHGNVIDTQLDLKREALLDEIQQCYPKVFKEHQYPITENDVPFSIQLQIINFLLPKGSYIHLVNLNYRNCANS